MFCLALCIVSVPLYVLVVYPLFSCSNFFSSVMSFSLVFMSAFSVFVLYVSPVKYPAPVLFHVSLDEGHSGYSYLCMMLPTACHRVLARSYHQDIKIEPSIETVNYTLHWWIHRVMNLPLKIQMDEIKIHAVKSVSNNVLLSVPAVF